MEPRVQDAPDALMLRGFWYPAVRGDRVHGRRLVTTMLLNIPVVLGRDDRRQPFALHDSCPHRAMPLSRGWFDGEHLQCCYHGWKFEPRNGQCIEIPSLVPGQDFEVSRIFAAAFPCREQDGFLWVYIPGKGEKFQSEQESPGEPPKLPTFSTKYRLTFLSADLPVSVDHGIIGLMDPAHGPFVHHAWWWRARHSIQEKQKLFEPIPNGFRMSAHTPSSNSAPYKLLRAYARAEAITTTIDFVLPNCRYETVHAGRYWFSSLTTVTPISADRSRIDVRAAWNVFRFVPGMLSLFRYFGEKFMEQDRRTMEMQAEGLKHQPPMTLIDDADRPAKWYFALKHALLESRRTGEPMKHPMSGPVTLHWRS